MAFEPAAAGITAEGDDWWADNCLATLLCGKLWHLPHCQPGISGCRNMNGNGYCGETPVIDNELCNRLAGSPSFPGSIWCWSLLSSTLRPLRKSASIYTIWMRQWPSQLPWCLNQDGETCSMSISQISWYLNWKGETCSMSLWLTRTCSNVFPSLWVLYTCPDLFYIYEHLWIYICNIPIYFLKS